MHAKASSQCTCYMLLLIEVNNDLITFCTKHFYVVQSIASQCLLTNLARFNSVCLRLCGYVAFHCIRLCGHVTFHCVYLCLCGYVTVRLSGLDGGEAGLDSCAEFTRLRI